MRKNSRLLGLQDLKEDELVSMVKEGDLDGDGAPMKHECVSGLGCECGCGTRQFLKKVGASAAGLSD